MQLLEKIKTVDLKVFNPCLRADAIYDVEGIKQRVKEGVTTQEIILNETTDESQPSINCEVTFGTDSYGDIDYVLCEIQSAYIDADTESHLTFGQKIDLECKIERLIKNQVK